MITRTAMAEAIPNQKISCRDTWDNTDIEKNSLGTFTEDSQETEANMDTKLPVAVTVFILRSIKSFHCLTEDLLWSQIPIRIIIATAKIPTPPQ